MCVQSFHLGTPIRLYAGSGNWESMGCANRIRRPSDESEGGLYLEMLLIVPHVIRTFNLGGDGYSEMAFRERQRQGAGRDILPHGAFCLTPPKCVGRGYFLYCSSLR